ncbi:hypothetical protein DRP07_10670 [Archaeoglobales archaeon]|nr:MAG: hypothetical protein DRP07_10670 [Archaeoglobales archaeon]
MRILVVSNLYPPYTLGGAEKYVYEVANKLSEKDDVFVITTQSFGFRNLKLKREGNVYRFYPLNLYHTYDAQKKSEILKPFWHFIDLWNPHSYATVKSLMKKLEPDVVFTHNIGNLSSAVFTAIKELEISHVHMLHDHSLLCPRATLCKSKGEVCVEPRKLCIIYRKIKSKFILNPDAVVAPSHYILDVHLKNGFFVDSKLFRLPLPVNRVERVKKDYDVLKVLYVGQIAVHKGIRVLIEAVKDMDGVFLDVVGSGEKLEFPSNTTYHGYLEGEKLIRLYKKANVVVLPSICPEVFGKVICEGFSYSTPAVGSRIGGIPEIIEDGKNGLLFTPNDAKRLKEILMMLRDGTSLLRKMEGGAEKTAKGLMMDAHVKKLRKILKTGRKIY